MKAVSILGTSSDAGKSWFSTALCALLRRKGIRVAPFKAQNMSNNSYATIDGLEIGRAQAVQAEACGLIPCAEMNPILLKPTGDSNSQVVLLGKVRDSLDARDYYKKLDEIWITITETLEYWKSKCDVLVMEGAGSPVELNLMDRDIVNLKPMRYLDGKWLLVGDIERGGIFAQAYGTYKLMEESDQKRGLGLVVNKFRGDMSLFADAEKYFSQTIDLPYLGTLPMRYDLQPESEDGFTRTENSQVKKELPLIAWVRMPRISNTQDMQPWLLDAGVRSEWVSKVSEIHDASIIILPGTKNTISDYQWLKDSGLAEAIKIKANSGTPVVGICGGYQMLGRVLRDEDGLAGSAGYMEGLSLLPVETVYVKEKIVAQVTAEWNDNFWNAYEIHMGRTTVTEKNVEELITVIKGERKCKEGIRFKKIWGTYLHGLFESSAVRQALVKEANIMNYKAREVNWREYQLDLYNRMADLIEEHIDLKTLWNYVNS
jgi:adenosylcobyric acid synthase